MNRSAALFLAPAFLILAIAIGGSAQGIWANLILQLVAIGLVAWSLLIAPQRTAPSVKHLRLIILAALAWIIIQLIPLPPGIWSALPGQGKVVAGYELLGLDLPWRPVSLDPNAGISTLLAVLPAAAMLALTVRIPPTRPAALVATLLGMTFLAILLGILQKGSGGGFQMHAVHNTLGVNGPFANSNHMAALLLVAIPFVAAIAMRWIGHARNAGERTFALILSGGFAAILLLGIVLNDSFSILLLGLPVLAASSLLVLQRGRLRTGRAAAMVAGLIAAGAAVLLAAALLGSNPGNKTSVVIRKDIWTNSLEPASEHMLTGSGLGTFEQVYALTEDPAAVDWTYINHAHNDYLELLIELGIPGAILLLLFLLWWGRRVIELWRMNDPPPFARAATIATAALLAHSFVDFPMRTAALSCVFAMSLGLMLAPRPLSESRNGERLGKARHLRLEDLD